jgi:hypothetical protein
VGDTLSWVTVVLVCGYVGDTVSCLTGVLSRAVLVTL